MLKLPSSSSWHFMHSQFFLLHNKPRTSVTNSLSCIVWKKYRMLAIFKDIYCFIKWQNHTKKPVISSVLHLQMLLSLSHSFQSLTFHQSLCNIHSYILTFLINIQQHSDFKRWPQTSLGTECAVNMCGHPVTSLEYVICIGCILAGLNSNSLETCSVSTIRIDVYTRQTFWWTEREGDICMHLHLQRHKYIHILCALIQPSMLLPYWFAVIKRDGVIHCLNPNMEALPSIEPSLTIHSQQEISTNTNMKTSNLTKSF